MYTKAAAVIADDDDDIDAELASLRRSLGLHSDADAFWRTTVLGGRWTKRTKKVTADFVLAFTRSAVAKTWAKAKRFPKSRRFSRSLYGPVAAAHLAKEFARRANFFAGQFFDRSEAGAPYRHTVESNEEYLETLEYLDWAVSLDAAEQAFSRVHELRLIVPRQGPAPR